MAEKKRQKPQWERQADESTDKMLDFAMALVQSITAKIGEMGLKEPLTHAMMLQYVVLLLVSDIAARVDSEQFKVIPYSTGDKFIDAFVQDPTIKNSLDALLQHIVTTALNDRAVTGELQGFYQSHVITTLTMGAMSLIAQETARYVAASMNLTKQ